MEHSRHRSIKNFCCHIIAALISSQLAARAWLGGHAQRNFELLNFYGFKEGRGLIQRFLKFSKATYILAFVLAGCTSNIHQQKPAYKFNNRNQNFIGVTVSTPLSEEGKVMVQDYVKQNDFLTVDDSWPVSDDEKLSAFIKVANSEVANMWAIRGGYGSYRLIDNLSKIKLKKKKTFIGYSDVTAVNIYLSQNTNWRVIHGPIMLDVIRQGYEKHKSLDLLSDIVANNITYSIDVTPINSENHADIKGKITGGNLTLVEGTLGTKNEIQTDNKIVFLEDVNIHSQYFCRSMYHLYAAGKFNKVKAIIIGSINKEYPNKHCIEVLQELAKLIKAPIFVTDKIGHGTDNVPIIYNSNTEIKGNKVWLNCSN